MTLPTDGTEASYADPERWDRVAADYDRWAGAFTAHYARVALALAGGVGPGTRVLDVAAGTGALTLAAAEAGAAVLATDISPGMVATLTPRLRPFAGCEAKVMDGQALPLETSSFDAGFSVFGIMLFPDWRAGLAELVRVVKPGGRVGLVGWVGRYGAGPMVPFMEAYRATFPDVALPEPPDSLAAMGDATRFAAALRDAGCRDVEIVPVDGAWTATSLDDVMTNCDSLMRFSPLYAALGDEDRARLEPRLRAAFAAFAAPGGALRVPATANVGLARKA